MLSEDRWFLAARRSLSLGHQALRRLGLPVPGRPEGIAEVLHQAGVVRARDAAWVVDAYGQWSRGLGSGRLRAVAAALAQGRGCCYEDHIERAWDFAWSVQVALERSDLCRPVPPAASGDDTPATTTAAARDRAD